MQMISRNRLYFLLVLQLIRVPYPEVSEEGDYCEGIASYWLFHRPYCPLLHILFNVIWYGICERE